MNHSVIRATAVLFGLSFGGLVYAADFTFRVPVDLQNLHRDVKDVKVLCRVFITQPAAAGDEYDAKNIIADIPAVSISINNEGSYRGTVSIPINALSGKDPSMGKYYQCYLVINGYRFTDNTTMPIYQARPGTKPILLVSGAVR